MEMLTKSIKEIKAIVYFYTDEAYAEPLIKSDIRFNMDKKFRTHHITIPDVHTYL
jgi:small-conductance mechanosensitive channel